MSFRWTNPPSRAWNIQLYVRHLMKAAVQLLDYWAPVLEAYAKRNATWVDRTGNARQTLHAFVLETDSGVRLVLKQQMYYGVFLELKNPPAQLNPELDEAGKYAIVMPTLELHYGQIWNSFRELVA